MKRLGGLLRKQDAFGEPISINYKGDATFTTMLGAIISLVEKVFILVVGVMGLIDLFSYKDSNITQYSVYDARLDGKEINFKEAHGSFLFGIIDYRNENHEYVELDPRFGKLTMAQLTIAYGDDLKPINVIQEVSVDKFTRKDFPEEFE